MSEKKYVYRLCPCNACDIECIQSWLEDMAAEGLFLIKEGIFCNVLFTFERRQPQKVSYRLDVALKRKARFMDSGDQLTNAELELYRDMGWEYLLQFGDFRIYRALCCGAPELNTESETHAHTINLLKKKQKSEFIWTITALALWHFWDPAGMAFGFKRAAVFGPMYIICLYIILLCIVFAPLSRAFHYRRYMKRLMNGESLTRRADWKRRKSVHFAVLGAALLLCLGTGVGTVLAFTGLERNVSQKDFPGEPPFATVSDVFPNCEIKNPFGSSDYYGKYEMGGNPIARYIKWNEGVDVTTADGERYFCIVIVEYYDTYSEWFAEGLEQELYLNDTGSYAGGEDLKTPDLDVDSIRAYEYSSGIAVLMREGNRVAQATVLIQDKDEQNQWQLWAEAMAEKMK